MTKVVLYGLGRTGDVRHSEVLQETDPARLGVLAQARLRDFYTVEVWVGCVRAVRLRRTASEQA